MSPSESMAYVQAILQGDQRACCLIEQRHGLYGVKPEYVFAALKAKEACQQQTEETQA